MVDIHSHEPDPLDDAWEADFYAQRYKDAPKDTPKGEPLTPEEIEVLLSGGPRCENCGKPMPKSTSPEQVHKGWVYLGDPEYGVYLCPDCASPGEV